MTWIDWSCQVCIKLGPTERTNEYQAICSTVPTIKCNKTERWCGVWCVQYLRYLIAALYFWCLHYCCHKFGISNWFKHSRPSIIVIYKIVDRLVLLWKNLNWMHHMYCLKKTQISWLNYNRNTCIWLYLSQIFFFLN